MNKGSHILMGRLLLRHLKARYALSLDAGAFLFGSILPDISPCFMLKMHTLGNYGGDIERRIGCLINQKLPSAYVGKRYSRELGIICHYYADFFCYPHTPGYPGDLKSHMQYERALYGCFLTEAFAFAGVSCACRPRGGVDAGRVMDSLYRRLDDYAGSEASLLTDITHGYRACAEALVTILSAALAVPSETPELCFPTRIPV